MPQREFLLSPHPGTTYEAAALACRDTTGRPSQVPAAGPAQPPSGIPLQELVEAEVSGLQVFLDTVRYDPDANQIWLLSLSGQSTAVRGAWANLTGFHSYLKLVPSERLLTLADGGLGWRSRSSRVGDPKRLGRAWEHIVLLPRCTETWGHIGEMLREARSRHGRHTDEPPGDPLIAAIGVRVERGGLAVGAGYRRGDRAVRPRPEGLAGPAERPAPGRRVPAPVRADRARR